MLRGSYANGFSPRDGQPRHPSLWHGCVSAWCPGLGSSGVNLRDNSPKKNHASTWTGLTAADAWVPSEGRMALRFPGSGTVSAVLTTPSYSEFTFACWVRSERVGTRQVFYGVSAVFFDWRTTNNIGFYKPGAVGALSTTAFAADRWYHVAGVYRGGAMEIWVNGKREASTTTALPALGTMAVGQLYGLPLLGSLDDLFVYDHAKSGAEIALLAQRRGIAYEMRTERYAGESIAAFNRRRRLLTGVA